MNTPQRAAADKFLPVTRRDLVEVLGREGRLEGADRERFLALADLLAHVFHFLFHQELRSLKRDYFPFDPDTVNRLLQPLSSAEREVRAGRVAERFQHILRRANYERLSEGQLNELLNQTSPWGLRLEVDLSQYRQFCLYYRGDGEAERTFRALATLFRKKTVRYPVFHRLALLVQFKKDTDLSGNIDPRFIYLKLFKNIPRSDLEMLFPNTVPRMKLLDKLRVALPLIGGAGTTIVKVLAAAAIGLVFAATVAAGFVVYAVRSFFGYLNVKEKYHGTLVANLYFNSLDNNRGVIHHLIDQAEEEECKEAVLAYYFLLAEPETGAGEAILDRRIEAFVAERFGVHMNFEAPDALAKLERLALLEQDPDGRLRVPSLAGALARLDRAWDNYFTYGAEPQA